MKVSLSLDTNRLSRFDVLTYGEGEVCTNLVFLDEGPVKGVTASHVLVLVTVLQPLVNDLRLVALTWRERSVVRG